MANTATYTELQPLSQTDLTVMNPAEDIRGATVLDSAGDEFGSVDDLLIDSEERRVRFMQIGAGGFLGLGEDKYLVPIDAITSIEGDRVRIDRSREHVAGGPTYDPALGYEEDYYGDVYGHYGYGPYWGAGYAYPAWAPGAR